MTFLLKIFCRPAEKFSSKDDVILGISGSGNSKNVLKAIEYANEHGGITVGLTGYDGGKLRKMVHYSVHVPINDMQITEDLIWVLDHCMMKILCTHNSCC